MPRYNNNNEYDNSVKFEFDWDTDDPRIDAQAGVLTAYLGIRGNQRIIRKHVRAFLIFCSRIERYAPNKYISYSRDNSYDSLDNFPNPYKLKFRNLKKVVDAFSEHGVIEKVRGLYYEDFRRLSRFKLRNDFRAIIRRLGLDRIEYTKTLSHAGIILKDHSKRILEYQDTQDTLRYKEELARYNDLISRTRIELFSAPENQYFYDNIKTYRVFNNSSFEQGGRFYGGWWTNCSECERLNIFINDQHVTEFDYKANHLYMIYGLENMEMPEYLRNDPYDLGETYPRKLVKAVFVRAINADTENQACRSFLKTLRDDDDYFDFAGFASSEHYRAIINMLIEKHPIIESYLHSAAGFRLMYHDSRIASWILNKMTMDHIPCLCIHDSFITAEQHEDTLKEYMAEAYTALGMPYGLPMIERKNVSDWLF